MFLNSFQPNIISLFSSTSSSPLQLFSKHVDKSLQSDSFIHLLNDSTSEPIPPSPAALIALPTIGQGDEDNNINKGYQLCQTVLHIQSPTLKTTYIRCPPALNAKDTNTAGSRRGSARSAAHSASAIATPNADLGIKHPWLHIQVRNLGREWSFEVGIVDQSGRNGVIRWSTFQKEPALKDRASVPLLHLPLSFPNAASRPLTAWSTVSVNLSTLIPFFQSLPSSDENEDKNRLPKPLPGGRYSHVSYIKIYSSCRLRRIWFTESRITEQLPYEFRLYSSD